MAKVPEQVASGVYRVDVGPYSNAISVLLIADEEGWALVDAGSPASPFRIQGALASLQARPDELKRIYPDAPPSRPYRWVAGRTVVGNTGGSRGSTPRGANHLRGAPSGHTP
jgi:hypothetical protein